MRRIEAARSPILDIGILWSKSSNRLPLVRAFLAEAIDLGRLKDRIDYGARQTQRVTDEEAAESGTMRPRDYIRLSSRRPD